MNFELRFTDNEITAWGGMALMKRMLDHLGFVGALAQAYGFAADNFNRNDFGANGAALNTGMLVYNQIRLFRQVLLKNAALKGGVSTPIQHTLQTLRYVLLAKPAYTTAEGRKPILNSAIAMQQRQWMKGLLDEATQFDFPVKFATNHPP